MRRQSIIRRLYNFTWRYKMTPAGKALSGLIGVTSLGTVSTQVPVFQICCVLLGVLIVAELLGVVFKPNLTVTANWPASVDVGEVVTIPVRVTNNSRWRSAYDLMATLLESPAEIRHLTADRFLSRLAPQESAELAVVIQARQRGRFTIGAIDVHSTFPFNLVRMPGGRTGSTKLIVTPIGPPLTRFDLPVDEGSNAGQFVLSGQTGESTEYLGNREYSPGEPVRRLDFRAWARLGKPVVREYQDEFASRVGLLVDTLETRSRFGFSRQGYIEEAICVAVSAMRAVVADDFQIAWLATASDMYVFPDDMQRGHEQEVLERLATTITSTEPVYDRMFETLANEADRCASVVLVLSGWDEARRSLVEELSLLQTPAKVILITSDDAAPIEVNHVEMVCLTVSQVRAGEVDLI